MVAAVLGALLVTGAELPWLVVAGVVMATAVGLVDDIRPQPASVRLVALTVAAVPIAVGLPLDRLDQLALPARVGVVVLLVLMANAVNLIDGQDGLAGGLGAIASVGLAAVIAANGATRRSPWWWPGRWSGSWPGTCRRPGCSSATAAPTASAPC